MLKPVFKTLITLTFLAGCQTSGLHVKSSPQGALVEYFDTNTNAFTRLGKTPLRLRQSRLERLPGVLQLRVSQKGYFRESASTRLDGSSVVKLFVGMEKSPEPAEPSQTGNGNSTGDDGDTPTPAGQQLAAENLVASVQLLNQLVEDRQLSKATDLVESLVSRYPQVHTLWDMKGSVHFLGGDWEQAVLAYLQSLRLNPNNSRTRAMLEKVEAKR